MEQLDGVVFHFMSGLSDRLPRSDLRSRLGSGPSCPEGLCHVGQYRLTGRPRYSYANILSSYPMARFLQNRTTASPHSPHGRVLRAAISICDVCPALKQQD